jgi:hypothetical protein
MLLVTDLVAKSRRQTATLSPEIYSDQDVAWLVFDALELLSVKGFEFVFNAGMTWDTAGLVSPPPTPGLNAIIALQVKILANGANPLNSLSITGISQTFDKKQIQADDAALEWLIIDYLTDLNPYQFVQNEYDVLANPGVQIRTLRSLLFPNYQKNPNWI